MRLLFKQWTRGIAARDHLICAARMRGFDGFNIIKHKNRPFAGNKRAEFRPPLANRYFPGLIELFSYGIKDNIAAHTFGEAVYLWRESEAGYEYLSFDYGPGVMDASGRAMTQIETIFDRRTSFRGGAAAPDGRYRGGGQGIGMTFLAAHSYFARVVSMGNGLLKVVDKYPGLIGDFQKSNSFRTTQVNLELRDDIGASGMMIHGLIPHGDIGSRRGSWQRPPAKNLDRLEVGDRVTLVYFKVEEGWSGSNPGFFSRPDMVIDQRIEHRGVIKEIPSPENQGVFVFEDGLVLGADKVKAFNLANSR